MKKLIPLSILIAFSNSILAFTGDGPAEDFMYSSGKIYVVVGVLVAIFLGLVICLLIIDRRLTKLENQIHTND